MKNTNTDFTSGKIDRQFYRVDLTIKSLPCVPNAVFMERPGFQIATVRIAAFIIDSLLIR